MASDGSAHAELLDELLLQDTGEMVETHESEPAERTEALAGVAASGEDVSAEDVLRQLDSVTLSLDGGTSDAVENLGDSEPIGELLICSQNAAGGEKTVASVGSAVEEDEDEEVMVDALEEAPAVEAVEVRPESSSDPQVRLSSTETNEAESAPLVAHVIGQTEESASAEAEDLLSSGSVSTEAEEAAAPDQREIPCAANGEELPNSRATVAAESDETEWEAVADPPLETQQHSDAQAPDDGDQLTPEGLSNESDGNLAAVDSTSPPREDFVLTEQTVLAEQPALMEQTGAEGEGEYQSQQPSGDGSGEPVVPRPELNVGDGVEYLVSPPPAPMATLPQPTFSGSLNPTNASSQDAGDDNDGDDDDDDSDSENEDEAVIPPPLSLEAMSDNEEELEVDTVVAEEIRAIKRKDVVVTETESEGQASIVSNPLLMALATGEQDHAAKMTLPADRRSKADDIAFGVDDPLEVRAAQVPVVHPESSAVAFGIGYQSLRKRPDREGCDDAYSIAKGPTFQDLESEVTLQSDASLAQRRSDALAVEPAEDVDEFGAIPDGAEGDAGAVSPTRVETILQATRASLAMRSAAAEEAVLVEELKRATVHEKRHLRETPPPEKTKPTENDGALTVKELHSIYKRGLGDHEVRLLDDGEAATVPSAGETTHRGPHELTTPAIAEENEEEEDAHDADAVRVTSERTATFADHSVNSMRDDDSNEWREIHLQPHLQLAPPLPSVSSARHADANACSRITYAEALRHFLESDAVLAHRDSIVAEEKPLSASCFSCFSRPRLAFGGAIEQRDRFFCVAATQFDPRNAVHVGMLQTIYRKLLPTGSRADVALMGPHWETIGFQGSDPSTDLRGCGVLSLLQMLHFVETHAEVARRFHAVSQHPTRHFPLACALINVTLQCVVVLRSGALYKESNKRRSVFDAANALHAAIATQLMKEIQVTSEDIPLVMKRVLDNGRLYPDRAIETHALESSDAQPPSPRKASAMAASRAPSSHAAAGEFTEIGLHSVADD